MQTKATIVVNQRLKFGLPLKLHPVLPKSWRRVYCDQLDISNELSEAEFEWVWLEDWPCSDLEIDVEIEGTVRAGTPDYFCNVLGNWHPGDSPEIEWKAWLGSIRIDPEFHDRECERIETEFYKQWED